MLSPKISFEEFETALKPVKDASPAAFGIGVIYGAVCAPHAVSPTQYLPDIIGFGMELPDPETADRLLALIHALHNQLAEMIEDDLPLNMRRKKYSEDKAGLVLQAKDLQQEAEGFQEGLFSGVETKGDLPKVCATHVAQLVLEQRYLTSFERSVRAKKTPLTDDDLLRRHQELESRSVSIAHAMQSIAHILYLKRVKSYKAQGVSRIGRNDPCPCGSGKKFKHCCLDKIKPSNAGNN